LTRTQRKTAICELEAYGLSPRAIEAIDDLGFLWIEDLTLLNPEEFLQVKGTGKCCIQQIEDAIDLFARGPDAVLDKKANELGEMIELQNENTRLRRELLLAQRALCESRT
jgi:hypothetical protein